MTDGTTAPQRPLKIGILGSRGFPSTYGGYETLVRHLARQWVAEGHDVTVYCRTRHESGRKWMMDGVRCLWTPGMDSTSLSTLTFGATSHIDAALRGYDAVLVLNVANGFFLPMLRARGIPSALNTDGIEWARGKWNRFAQLVFLAGAHLSARYANTLVADSRAIGDIWREQFGVDTRFIPYGGVVSEDQSTKRIEELGLEPERYVLAVARLIPENNVSLLLDATETTAADGSRIDVPVVVVGSSTADSEIEQRLGNMAIEGRVRWMGHVSDQELLRELWSRCGVYVHGHSVGGTNPALLQALGAGAPTIALDTAFNREVLEHDEQLFPRDPQALTTRIVELLGDRGLRERFRAHGQHVVEHRYSWNDVCRDYLSTLMSLAGRPEQPSSFSAPNGDRPLDHVDDAVR